MLRITNLTASVKGKRIIKRISLRTQKGKATLLLGPNGSGKSTLLYAILGYPIVKVVEGAILLDGSEIIDLPMEERVEKGLALAFQNPPKIKGVRLREILYRVGESSGLSRQELKELAERLKMTSFLDRYLFDGFSGGEVKRAELLLTLAQKPKVLLLDEPDSGVDVESIGIVGQAIEDAVSEGSSALIVTHSGLISKYVLAEDAYVLLNGTIGCHGPAEEIVSTIFKMGFKKCVECFSFRIRGGVNEFR